jgi:PTH1 family peptidyl-tRNA hydrolase
VWLFVGLGNPGSRYERTRHNIGFRVVDEVARRHGIGPLRSKLGGELATGMIGAHKVLLLKPMEFMNTSGFAVQKAAQFYGVEVRSIAVVHDDIDLDPGRLKLKSGGGHGGHNGLRSLVEQLGEAGFARVRCGVGKPPRLAQDGEARDRAIAGYVLSDVPAAQAADIDAMIARAADAVEGIAAHGIGWAMNQFNAPPTQPSPRERGEG